MSDHLATFVDIILPLPLSRLYTYRISREQEPYIKIGQRVLVQFGAKKMYAGIVQHIHYTPPPGYEAKYVLELLDEEPVVDEKMLQFWHWLATYYICHLGDVMQAALPAALKPQSQTHIKLHPEADIASTELSEKEFLIMEALIQHQVLTLDEVSEILQLKQVFSLLKSLYQKELIVIEEQVTESYKPKTITCVRLHVAFRENEDRLEDLFKQLEKKEAQLNLLMAYMLLSQDMPHVEKKALLQKAQTSESPLQTCIKNGVFEYYTMQVDRLHMAETTSATFELNDEQQQAWSEIKSFWKTLDTVLLHGVTSSGKTHVYVKLIEEQLQLGKQVLLLVPEIALTSQMIGRINAYFGNKAAAYHSRFSSNERMELWQKVRNGSIQVIIGARSSVFLPFSMLNLVIVDEEHEPGYKQSDPAPRYHARDAAIMLAKIHGCKTLLGSATPAFETYHNAMQQKFGLVKLEHRHGKIALPIMVLSNIAEDKRTKRMTGNLGEALLNQIKHAIDKGEQVILFQNRRGYAPIYECDDCHHVVKCRHCDISLTYHKYNDSLKCHYCGYAVPRMLNCEACGSHKIELKGLGTEKIEDEISALFPNSRLLRLDLDTTRSKNGHSEIIRQFQNHEADILIGTQMLSKGLDFPGVSLVGVINADQLLHFPDFRAHERAYQLLTQVGGRAGRSQKQGQVIIQTHMPQHQVLQAVVGQQYNYVYATELDERKNYFYPPFTRLVLVRIKDRDVRNVTDCADTLFGLLQKRLSPYLIGPQSPYVSKVKNYYVKEILIKLDRNLTHLAQVKLFIKNCINEVQTQKSFKRSIIYADVDPI